MKACHCITADDLHDRECPAYLGPKSSMKTPYSEAWRRFEQSEDFPRTADPSTVGSDPKYLINRLRLAFDAGWNSKGSHILEALERTLQIDRPGPIDSEGDK